MSDLNDNDDAICILIEGPAWDDAVFWAHWLLVAEEANRLLQDAKKDDPEFHDAIFTLELYGLDLRIMAKVFLSQFDKNFYTFTIEVSSEDLDAFALMVEMGFFKLTGDRYQMTIPENLDRERVMQAHLRLQDENWVHLESLLVGMPRSRARRYESLLGSMNQDQRLADRRALLFID